MRLTIKQLCIVIIAVLSFQQAGAQFSSTYNFKFRNYTTKDGLVHNYVKRCQADSKGFLWIITQHGLSRFDGLNFRNFEHIYGDLNSLPENDLEDIAIDKNDRIWLSYRTGLCYYDQSAHRFYIVKQKGAPIPSFSIVFDTVRNCIWSLQYETYLKIDCNDYAVQAFPFQKKMPVVYSTLNCMKDSRDRLWVLIPRKGYYTIDLKTNKQFYYDQDIWPMQVYEDELHQIWMTTWQSGFRKINVSDTVHEHVIFPDIFNSKEQQFSEIHYGITQSDALGGNNILWITNNTNGILLFDKLQKKFVKLFEYDANIKNGIATNFNNTIYTDRKGIIWICTWNGITKVNAQEQQFNSRELSYLKTKQYNRVAGIIDDPENNKIAWLGVEGSGVVKFDKDSGKIIARYFYDITGGADAEDKNYNWRWVKKTFIDSSKNIWMPTYGGLIRITNGTVKQVTLRHDTDLIYPNKILEYPKGTLWLTTRAGLFNYDIKNGTFKYFKNALAGKAPDGVNERLRDILLEDRDHFLVASPTGVYEYNILTGDFKLLQWKFEELDNGGQHNCYSLEKINNSLFIGTNTGLIRYDLTTNKAAMIGKEDGIEKVGVSRLKKDRNNNLWIFTSYGLFKFDPAANNFQKFTTGDGIYDFNEDEVGFFEYHNEFNIGYRMALTSFDPLSVNVNKVKCNPVVTDILINNEIYKNNIDSLSVHLLQLNYKKNNLTFSFTCADFTNSDKITFAYQLEGYDKDWIYAGTNRTAAYTNLKGGSYVFKVKACNSSGLWNEKVYQVKIKIGTPFWQTIWFYLLVAALIIFIAYKIYRYRVNQLIQLYKVRDLISKNLHDEIGATLSSINIYSDVARKKTKDDKEVNGLLERIYKASGQVMESMNDIVWFVNPKNDSWDNIIVRMREYAIPLLEAKDIIPDFDIDESLLKQKLNMQQRQHIYFIFKEAINNIVKYSGAKNVIVKLVRLDNHTMSLKIKDDGKGFNKEESRSGNGLNNMRQRSEQMNGKLLITSVNGEGTLLELQLGIA